MLRHVVVILSIFISLTYFWADTYISVNPLEVSIAPGEQIPYIVGLVRDGEVQQVLPWDFKFSATQGSFSGNVYKAPRIPGTYMVSINYKKVTSNAIVNVIGSQPVKKIMIEPQSIDLIVGQTHNFKAGVYSKSKEALFYQVVWMTKGAKIDRSGNFIADKVGVYKIIALGPNGIKANAQVTVRAKLRQLKEITIKSAKEKIWVGEKLQLKAQGYDQDNNIIDADIKWLASFGEENSSGYEFLAEKAGKYQIVAVNEKTKIKDFIEIEVVNEPSVLQKIQVYITKNNLYPDTTTKVEAQAYDQNGAPIEFDSFWSATGGTINDLGVFTAGKNPGAYVITAKDVATGIQGHIEIEVQPEIRVLKRIEIISAQNFIDLPNGSLQISASGFDQHNEAISFLKKWTSSGGEINNNAVFTAQEEGEYTITVTDLKTKITASKKIFAHELKILPPIHPIDVDVPDVDVPDVDVPNVDVPNIDVPDVDIVVIPDVVIPDVPDIVIPEDVIDEFSDDNFIDNKSREEQDEFFNDTIDNTSKENKNIPDEKQDALKDYSEEDHSEKNDPLETREKQDILEKNNFADIAPPVINFKVTPNAITLQPGDTHQFIIEGSQINWQATGGTINQNGFFTAGNTIGDFVVTASNGEKSSQAEIVIFQGFQEITKVSRLEINPNDLTIEPGENAQFSVSGYDKDNNKIFVSVKWEATGGNIDQNGRYVAGNKLGQYSVKVTYNNVNTSSRVVITKNNEYRLKISPREPHVKPGETVRFQISLSKGSKEIWSWPWEYTFITSNGKINDLVYTAPEKPGAYTIEIRHPKATSHVVVVVSSPTQNSNIAKINVNRENLTLGIGAKYVFTANAINSSGIEQNISLLWRANGGEIDANGTFTAGQQAGNYTIEVSDPLSGISKTIQVSIVSSTLKGYEIELEPKNINIPIGTQQKITFKLRKGSFEEFSWPWEYKVISSVGKFENGLYTAPTEIGTCTLEVVHKKAKATFKLNIVAPKIVSFKVIPKEMSVKEGKNIKFTAIVAGVNGKVDYAIDWSVSGGKINSDGNYTASVSGLHTITAKIKGTDITSEAKVKVAGSMKMSIAPKELKVAVGQSLRLKITMYNGREKIWAWPWEFKCSATKGSFHETLYKAPNEPGIYKVKIRYKKWAKRTKIHVYATNNTESRLVIAPNKITLSPLEKHTFQAQLFDSYNNKIFSTVKWRASGGVIEKNGVYTAGATAGEYEVSAFDKDLQLRGKAIVKIVTPVERIVVEPATKSLRSGDIYQFKVYGMRSNGKKIAVNPKWQATGGKITSNGLYTAGTKEGQYFNVTVRLENGLSSSANVRILNNSVTQLKIIPEKIVLSPGGNIQFRVVGVGQQENDVPITPKWFAIGGTVDKNGVYYAGNKVGRYYVTVIDAESNLFAKALVTIQQKKYPTNDKNYSLKISVSSKSVKPGENVIIKPALSKNGSVEWTWPWEYKYSTSAGTLVGEYGNIWIAPRRSGRYSVTISHRKATTSIFLNVDSNYTPQVQVEKIKILPRRIELQPNKLYKFSAVAYKPNGRRCPCKITWSATGGKIDQSGTYQAGSIAGTFNVTARYRNIKQTAQVIISQSHSNYQLGVNWGRSLRAGTRSRRETHKYIYANVFTKSSRELEQFRRGFINGYGTAGLYLVQELLCNVASDFGKIYGHKLYWGNVTKKQLSNFLRSYIIRLPRSCHHSFKQGFVSGYKHYKGSSIYDQIYRWAKYRK